MTKNKAKEKALDYFWLQRDFDIYKECKTPLKERVEKAIDIAISETNKECEDELTNKDIQWSRKLNKQIHELKQFEKMYLNAKEQCDVFTKQIQKLKELIDYWKTQCHILKKGKPTLELKGEIRND